MEARNGEPRKRPWKAGRAFGTKYQYAGEGELHPLMREAGFNAATFCKFAGISEKTFREWYGHPMHRMPIALLEHFIWSTNMAKFMSDHGWDPAQFKAKGLPPTPDGRYPRTAAQGRELLRQVEDQTGGS